MNKAWFMIVISLALVPQILHFAVMNIRAKPDYYYNYIFLLARFLIMVKIFSKIYKKNFKKLF